MTTIPIRIKRGVGVPTQLRQGELAWDQASDQLYIGSGTEVNGFAPNVVAISGAAASAVSSLSDVDLSTLADNDILVYDSASQTWLAEAIAVAWADVTGKPTVFTPDTHNHAWGDITSGVPSTFAPSAHASSHHTGGADAITPSNIGAAAASHTHDAATTSVAGFMSSSDKTKLDGIATGAEVNVNADWNASSGDAQILNKPTLGTAAAAATTDFIAASAASAFGLTLIDDADASAARTTLGLGSAATSASGDFAAASHSHAWSDITSGVPSTFTPASHTHGNISNDGKIGTTADALVKTGSGGTLTTLGLGFTDQYLKTGVSGPEWASLPSTFTPSAHSHTIKQELSGFIESPEAKTYVLSPSTNAAMTITQLKAQTSAGTVDVKIQDDGADVTGATLADAGTTLASLASDISVSVAAGSKLTLVVSDPQSSPANLAFAVHYTIASENNA